MTQVVDHYGIYHDSELDAKWILQQGGAVSLIGLPKESSPFKIKSKLLYCPHNFNLSIDKHNYYDLFEQALRSNWVCSLFDPLKTYLGEDKKVYYISLQSSTDYQTLSKIQNLMSPAGSMSFSLDNIRHDKSQLLERRLLASNLSTPLIFGFTEDNINYAKNLIDRTVVLNKKLVLSGLKMPLYNYKDSIVEIELSKNECNFFKELSNQDVRDLGAFRLKKYLRS